MWGLLPSAAPRLLSLYRPPDVLPQLDSAVRASAGDLADGHHLVAALGPRAGGVLKQAWYGYATARTLAPAPGRAVRCSPIRRRAAGGWPGLSSPPPPAKAGYVG